MGSNSFLAICAIARDETPYLEEWVRFHRALGVDHFHLYDNESVVPIVETLASPVAAGYVTVERIVGRALQAHAYLQFARQAAGRWKWVAFIDIDEFIVPRRGTIPDLLVGVLASGLSLNWQMFGSSGHVDPPPGPVTEAFLHRLPEIHPTNHHVKSIVRPKHVISWQNPHRPLMHNGTYCVGEDGKRVPGPFRDPTTRTAFVAHYWTKSWSEWIAKVARGRADMEAFRRVEEGAVFDSLCVVEDRTVSELSARLASIDPR